MRVLHTSDWHLGRSFGDFRLLDDQRAFIDWLVGTVHEQRVELVVVAGDLFDRAIPPVEAVALFRSALLDLRAAGAQVVAIAGNHDSAERIGVYDGLVADGLVIRGGYSGAADVEVLECADGPVAVVAAPFLDPLLAPPAVRNTLTTETGCIPADRGAESSSAVRRRIGHEAVLRNALSSARHALPESMRSIVVAHAFVTGAAPSDSERDLAVGDAGMVSASVFDDFDYVALGHLHRPQTVNGHEHIVYSGSPLPYSFSETHDKTISIIDMDVDGSIVRQELVIPVGRQARTVRGHFDELIAAEPTDDWVRAELLDSAIVPDAHRRLRGAFPHLVEIARVGHSTQPGRHLTVEEAAEASPSELTLAFWAEVTGSDATLAERRVLSAALDAAQGAVGASTDIAAETSAVAAETAA